MHRELTKALIKRHGLRDTSKRWHVPSGVLTYEANYLVFVCFDDYPNIGGRIFFFTMSSVVSRIMSLVQANVIPKLATLDPGSDIRDTGAGYCLHPYDKRLELKHVIDFDPSKLKDSHDVAVALVTAELERQKYKWTRATLKEEYRGIDLIARKRTEVITFEIKTRRKHQNKWRLFFQISETNPTRRIN